MTTPIQCPFCLPDSTGLHQPTCRGRSMTALPMHGTQTGPRLRLSGAGPHPTPEAAANAIRLYTKWNGLHDTRTWDDVRREIADALRAERKATFEWAIKIVHHSLPNDEVTATYICMMLEAEMKK